jgi:hypothetical protein
MTVQPQPILSKKEERMQLSSPVRPAIIQKLLQSMVLALLLMLSSCFAGAKHMIDVEPKTPLIVKPNKALLVIVRTTSLGFAVVIDNFLDGKMIGQTQGKSYFTADIKPGPHYLMAHAENWAVAHLNFEAGKMYLFEQQILRGEDKARTGFSPLSYEETIKQINERGSSYRVYNPEKPGANMAQSELRELKEDFENGKEEVPGRYKEYGGYSRQ